MNANNSERNIRNTFSGLMSTVMPDTAVSKPFFTFIALILNWLHCLLRCKGYTSKIQNKTSVCFHMSMQRLYISQTWPIYSISILRNNNSTCFL